MAEAIHLTVCIAGAGYLTNLLFKAVDVIEKQNRRKVKRE